MQSTYNQCSQIFAKSLLTTYYFSITIYQSDRCKKISYTLQRYAFLIKPDLSAERFSVSLPAWQRETNYIKGTSIMDSTIFQD